MARNTRHNKILEIISSKEIETQEELVSILKNLKFDVTQATVSRDIKELGLIKILTEDKKYKYAVAQASQSLSNKTIDIVKGLVISVAEACNLVCVKVVRGTASFVASAIEMCGINEVIGITYGDDTVLLVASNVDNAKSICNKLSILF